ncbi:MAG: hypothetical protein WBO08_17955 [Mycobacterium sp.]
MFGESVPKQGGPGQWPGENGKVARVEVTHSCHDQQQRREPYEH